MYISYVCIMHISICVSMHLYKYKYEWEDQKSFESWGDGPDAQASTEARDADADADADVRTGGPKGLWEPPRACEALVYKGDKVQCLLTTSCQTSSILSLRDKENRGFLRLQRQSTSQVKIGNPSKPMTSAPPSYVCDLCQESTLSQLKSFLEKLKTWSVRC